MRGAASTLQASANEHPWLPQDSALGQSRTLLKRAPDPACISRLLCNHTGHALCQLLLLRLACRRLLLLQLLQLRHHLLLLHDHVTHATPGCCAQGHCSRSSNSRSSSSSTPSERATIGRLCRVSAPLSAQRLPPTCCLLLLQPVGVLQQASRCCCADVGLDANVVSHDALVILCVRVLMSE